MNLLGALFSGGPDLEGEIGARVSHWQSLPDAEPHTPLADARFIVIDVESTGLDPHRDEILSVGLVPASMRGVEVGEMDEVLLHRESRTVDKENLVIHGITPTESAAGVDTDEALATVLERIGKSWLVAFHADFDRTILARALKRRLGVKLKNPFLDLAWLLPALYRQEQHHLRTLDDWLMRFAIAAPARHRASADAFVTAELLLVALSEARRQGREDVEALAVIAEAEAGLERMKQ